MWYFKRKTLPSPPVILFSEFEEGCVWKNKLTYSSSKKIMPVTTKTNVRIQMMATTV
jgi:hypothetical protein